jgi:hypothetical protein
VFLQKKKMKTIAQSYDLIDFILIGSAILFFAEPFIEYNLAICRYVFTTAVVQPVMIPYYTLSALTIDQLETTGLYTFTYWVLVYPLLRGGYGIFALAGYAVRPFGDMLLYGLVLLVIGLFWLIDMVRAVYLIWAYLFCSDYWFCFTPRVTAATAVTLEFLTILLMQLITIVLVGVVFLCILWASFKKKKIVQK